MLILNEDVIKKIYGMRDCIQDVEQAFRLHAENKTVSPIRTSVPHSKWGAETLYMPAYIDDVDYTAVKVVSIFPHNAKKGQDVLQGVILLTDAVTGEHVALLKASYLTVMRTGASSGVATKLLARENSKVCAVLGCGAQSLGQLQAVMEVRNIERIVLYNRTMERANRLKQELALMYNDWDGEIVIVDEANAAVEQSDIVICSSKSTTPIFEGNYLKPGTHVNAIGSYQPHMQEIDESTLKRSSKIVVDTLEGALHETGDFLIPIKKGVWKAEYIYGELDELITGKKVGREHDQEITLYKSVGIGFLDTMVAQSVYKKALELNVGINVSL
ncbi:ornithine cyclodeaminase family protein [Aneurinibacillus danicus]|uniref:Ornithine cyclodeaminase n=1 Tax=Aneurinibacillus danicus TaxID=267746 RepID=A0A511V5Y2_9BACL|nr:ornithine cyclodeaminase family protein [Aneurinibacillus danicus]GEN34364.1 ornithine cyclodeaminase [Aneurinibacillus danicus]